jgi:hypothetical protein
MDYFQEIETCSASIPAELLEYARTAPEELWRKTAGESASLAVPPSTFKDCPVVQRLLDKYGDVNRMHIQKLPPRSFYFWHRDDARNVGINLQLSGFPDAFTACGKFEPLKRQYVSVRHLRYEPCKLYLLNVSGPHCGSNDTDEVRFLVSMSLARGMPKYADVLGDLK